jgi:hypothetical protein
MDGGGMYCGGQDCGDDGCCVQDCGEEDCGDGDCGTQDCGAQDWDDEDWDDEDWDDDDWGDEDGPGSPPRKRCAGSDKNAGNADAGSRPSIADGIGKSGKPEGGCASPGSMGEPPCCCSAASLSASQGGRMPPPAPDCENAPSSRPMCGLSFCLLFCPLAGRLIIF